jgi:hypothetical protein
VLLGSSNDIQFAGCVWICKPAGKRRATCQNIFPGFVAFKFSGKSHHIRSLQHPGLQKIQVQVFYRCESYILLPKFIIFVFLSFYVLIVYNRLSKFSVMPGMSPLPMTGMQI